MARLEICEQQRRNCINCDENGRCNALTDTHFSKKCPFYKAGPTQPPASEENKANKEIKAVNAAIL